MQFYNFFQERLNFLKKKEEEEILLKKKEKISEHIFQTGNKDKIIDDLLNTIYEGVTINNICEPDLTIDIASYLTRYKIDGENTDRFLTQKQINNICQNVCNGTDTLSNLLTAKELEKQNQGHQQSQRLAELGAREGEIQSYLRNWRMESFRRSETVRMAILEQEAIRSSMIMERQRQEREQQDAIRLSIIEQHNSKRKECEKREDNRNKLKTQNSLLTPQQIRIKKIKEYQQQKKLNRRSKSLDIPNKSMDMFDGHV